MRGGRGEVPVPVTGEPLLWSEDGEFLEGADQGLPCVISINQSSRREMRVDRVLYTAPFVLVAADAVRVVGMVTHDLFKRLEFEAAKFGLKQLVHPAGPYKRTWRPIRSGDS